MEQEVERKKDKPERRRDISKPKVFQERRSTMWLIESATPTDIYIWCFCIVAMFLMLSISLILSYIQYYCS